MSFMHNQYNRQLSIVHIDKYFKVDETGGAPSIARAF